MSGFTINNGVVTQVGLWHGTIIKMRDGKRFKVTKINPVNVKMMDEDGKDGWTLSRDAAERMIDADQTWTGPKEKTDYDRYLELTSTGATLGTKVKLAGNLASKYPGEYVVVALAQSKGTFRIAKLGGDGGRYLRNIKPGEIEIVPV